MTDKPLSVNQIKAMFAAIDETRANEAWRQAEKTAAGDQLLIPGVKPLTEADKLRSKANAPLAGAGNQKPCNHGLFDECARDQIDLVELAKKGATK